MPAVIAPIMRSIYVFLLSRNTSVNRIPEKIPLPMPDREAKIKLDRFER